MEQSTRKQINISMPNLINICVDEKVHGEIRGKLYHCYSKEPVKFDNVISLLTLAEELFDCIRYPQASTKTRCFGEEVPAARQERPEKVVEQLEVIEHQGVLGSFVLCVKFRQNSTWQGEIIWTEKGIRRRFTNTLDFIKLLDGALGTVEI